MDAFLDGAKRGEFDHLVSAALISFEGTDVVGRRLLPHRRRHGLLTFGL